MGNDDAFRKVRDKLAGFEGNISDDSWQLFEKHRLRKERRRRLVGALGIGLLLLFIFGALIGFRALVKQRRTAAAHSGKSKAVVQKHPAEAPIIETQRRDKRPPRSNSIQSPVTKRIGAMPVQFQVEANHKPPGSQAIIAGLAPAPNDSPMTPSLSSPGLPRFLAVLPNTGASHYDVSLPLPSIRWDHEPVTAIPARPSRSFQLSIGPAVRANYTKPSDNRLTAGPAIFSTFPITSKLSLRGGLALMREHAYVSNTHPKATRNAVKWLNRGEYRWWDLEIPLDVQIAVRRNPRYNLSGLLGLSSSLYWGEHFRELYQKDKIVKTTLALYNGEIREVEGLVTKQEEPVTGRSSGAVFAPATYLNASILLEKKLTTRSSLAIEPQLKYPIGGVTSRSLKFTSVGLQIRILYR